MKKIWLLFLLAFSHFYCAGQVNEVLAIKRSLPNIQDSTSYVNALNRIAILYYEKNIDSTFSYTVKAREIANRINYEKGKADAMNNIDIFFDIKGNLQLALRYFNDAHLSYTKLKDSSNQIQTIMNIAMVYNELGNDGRSIAKYNDALLLGKKLRHDSIMSIVIFNYLLQFPTHFNKQDKSNYIAKASEIAKRYNDSRTFLAITQLRADELVANGDRGIGIKLLDSVINVCLDKKLYYLSMDMLIDIGSQLESTAPLRSVAYYQQGLSIANRNTYVIYSKIFTRKLFDFYLSRNDVQKANTYATQLINLLDQQEKLEVRSGVDYLDYALKEKELQSLLSKSKYQGLILLLSVIVGILAIVFAFSILKNLRRTKKLNQIITKKNDGTKKTLLALEQSQQDNTRMMKIAAHDLRGPIGGIHSLVTLMLEESNRSSEDMELLTAIQGSSINSLELVKDLLEIQFSTTNLIKEPLDIAEVLHHCISLLSIKAADKQQKIIFTSQEYVLPLNREKIWRVMSNLLSNAIKFSPINSVIQVKLKAEENRLLISIEDQGIGIPEAIRDIIFDFFTEAKRLGTEGEGTNGLGLAISKQIIEGHKGEIWFESEINIGTTFYVSLPLS